MFPSTDPKGQLRLMCRALILGAWRECEVIEANAQAQWVNVRLHGSHYNINVKFSQVQNVSLKWDDGTVEQSFGSPKISNPASLEFIQYQSVQA
jgi:hypothetical protein